MSSVSARLIDKFGSSVTLRTTAPINNQFLTLIVVNYQPGAGSGYLNYSSGYVDADDGDFALLKSLPTYASVTMTYAGTSVITNVNFYSP